MPTSAAASPSTPLHRPRSPEVTASTLLDPHDTLAQARRTGRSDLEFVWAFDPAVGYKVFCVLDRCLVVPPPVGFGSVIAGEEFVFGLGHCCGARFFRCGVPWCLGSQVRSTSI